jgi:hypothetical protein
MPSASRKRSSPAAIVLSSLVCPGTGQLVQRRWLVGSLFTLGFIGLFVAVCIKVLGNIAYNLRVAIDMSSGTSEPFVELSPMTLLLLFGTALVIYALNVADVLLAHRRWSRPHEEDERDV